MLKFTIISTVLIGGSALAASVDISGPTLWTSCKETTRGQMAITLPPSLQDNDAAIRTAIAQCNATLSQPSVLNNLIDGSANDALLIPIN